MRAKYMTKEEFKVIGMECKTTMDNNQHLKDLPKLWQEFMPRLKEIKIIGNGTYGLCKNDDDMNHFTYIACAESDDTVIPKGMISVTVPKSRYAVFLHKGPIGSLGKTYDDIFKTWLPKSKKELDPNGYCIGLYDNRFTSDEKSVMELWIAIK